MAKSPSNLRHVIFPRALAPLDVSADQLCELVLSVLEPATRVRAEALPTGEWDELAETVQTNLGQATALYNWSHYRTSHNDFTKRLRDFEKSLYQFLKATEGIEWTLQSAGPLKENVNHEVLFYAARFSEDAETNPRGAFERYRATGKALAAVIMTSTPLTSTSKPRSKEDAPRMWRMSLSRRRRWRLLTSYRCRRS